MEVREAIEAANGEEAVLRDIQEQVSLQMWQTNKCAVYAQGVQFHREALDCVENEEFLL